MLSTWFQPIYNRTPRDNLKSVTPAPATITEPSEDIPTDTEQLQSIVDESSKPEPTVLTVLDALYKVQQSFQRSRMTAPARFDLDYGFILSDLVSLSKSLLTLRHNAFSKIGLTSFTGTYATLCSKVSNLKSTNPELSEVDDALSRLYASLPIPSQSESDSDVPPEVITADPQHHQFKENIRAALSLLKNEQHGFGNANPIIHKVQTLTRQIGLEELQLPDLFKIVANLDKLLESESEIEVTTDDSAEFNPVSSNGNQKFIIIRLLRERIFVEITKEQGNRLKQLKNGLNRISDGLESMQGYQAERNIVHTLQKTLAAIASSDAGITVLPDRVRATMLFELNRELSRLQVLLDRPGHQIATSQFKKIQAEVSTIQKLLSVMPSLPDMGEVIDELTRETQSNTDDDSQKRLRELQCILSTIYPALENAVDPEHRQSFAELLILLNSFDFLQAEQWHEIERQILSIKKEIEEANQFSSAMLGPIRIGLERAVSLCQGTDIWSEQCNDLAPGCTNKNSQHKEILTKLTLGLEPLLVGVIDAGQRDFIVEVTKIIRFEKPGELIQLDLEKIMKSLDELTDMLNLELGKAATNSPWPSKKINQIDFAKKNVALIANLCEMANSHSGEQFDPRSRLGFLKVFKQIHQALKGFDHAYQKFGHKTEINPILDQIYDRLLAGKSSATTLSVEDWEFISLKLTSIFNTSKNELAGLGLEEFLEDSVHNGLKIGFIKRNIKYLTFVSDAAWTSSAHERIIDHLNDNIYRSVWDQSYSSMKTHTAEVGFFMPTFSAKGVVTKVDGDLTDDEGYLGSLDTQSLGFKVRGELGVEGILSAASLEAEGALTRGRYKEWDNARKKIIDDLSALIDKHKDDPIVMKCLKRRWPNGAVEIQPKRKPVVPKNKNDRPPPDTIETLDITFENSDRIEALYDLQNEHMSQIFSTLISVRQQQTLPRFVRQYSNAREKILTGALGVEKANTLNLRYKSGAISAKGTLGLDLGLLALTGDATAGGVNTTLHLGRNTSLCKKMERLGETEGYSDKGQAYQVANQIRAEITRSSAGIREKLDRDRLSEQWMRKQNLKRGVVLNRVQKAQLTSFLDEELQEQTHSWSRRPPSESVQLTKSDNLGHPVKGDKPAEELENLKRDVKAIEMEFNYYAHLHAQLSHGSDLDKNRSSIAAMHDRYGVVDAENCIYRMLLLTAWLYTKTLELEEAQPELIGQTDLLKKNLVRLEEGMHNRKLPVKDEKIKELSTFKEECQLETIDFKFALSGTADIYGLISEKISVEVRHRTRYHINPLRIGQYIDFEIRLNRGVTLMPRSEIIECLRRYAQDSNECIATFNAALDKYLSSVEQSPDMAGDFGTSLSAGTSFTFRLFKPALFPTLGFRFWNLRINMFNNCTSNVKFSALAVSAAYKYEFSKTKFLAEAYPSSSILYFALRFFHDYTIKDILDPTDKRNHGLLNGTTNDLENFEPVVKKSSYWATVREAQKKTLRDIFLSVGKSEELRRAAVAREEADTFISDCTVIKELDAIEAELNKISKGRDEHAEKIRICRARFMKAAFEYAQDKDEKHYQEALKEFEKLMLRYSPRLITMKKKSDLYKPQPFSLVSTSNK